MILDDPAVRDYVANSFVARVATHSPRGAPALTPLWFVVDAGRFYMATARTSLAARNAAAQPEIAILLDGEAGAAHARVLRLHGRAAVHDTLRWRVLARMAWKYYLRGALSELRHARLWGLRMQYYAQGEAAVIDFAPESAEWLPAPR